MSGLTAVVGTALGLTMMTATPAASVTQVAHKCEGSAVVRCANIEMPSIGVFNAHARVSDRAGGIDYDVQVTEVRLEYYVNGGWSRLKLAVPWDYWEYDKDVARTSTYSCGSSARKLVRAKVRVRWLSDTIGVDWVTTPSTHICPR